MRLLKRVHYIFRFQVHTLSTKPGSSTNGLLGVSTYCRLYVAKHQFISQLVELMVLKYSTVRRRAMFVVPLLHRNTRAQHVHTMDRTLASLVGSTVAKSSAVNGCAYHRHCLLLYVCNSFQVKAVVFLRSVAPTDCVEDIAARICKVFAQTPCVTATAYAFALAAFRSLKEFPMSFY